MLVFSGASDSGSCRLDCALTDETAPPVHSRRRPDPGRPQPIRRSNSKTAAVARLVDDQNAQKAKIARNTGCEHNRDAVRADP